MKRIFKKTASLLLCMAILAMALCLGTFATEGAEATPFDDLRLVQVFDYEGFKTVAVIQAVYENRGYVGVSFEWLEVKNAAGEVITPSARAATNNYFGFTVPLSEEDTTPYTISIKVSYSVFGGAPQTLPLTLDVQVKAPIDKSGLQGLLDSCAAKLSFRYTEESYQILTDAVAAATAFYEDVTQQQYEDFTKVYTDLSDAIQGLEGKYEGFVDTVFMLFEKLMGLLYSAFGFNIGGMLVM